MFGVQGGMAGEESQGRQHYHVSHMNRKSRQSNITMYQMSNDKSTAGQHSFVYSVYIGAFACIRRNLHTTSLQRMSTEVSEITSMGKPYDTAVTIHHLRKGIATGGYHHIDDRDRTSRVHLSSESHDEP